MSDVSSCMSIRMRTLTEPFKIKMVEPLKITSEGYRLNKLEEAYFNPFQLKSHDVFIDLLKEDKINDKELEKLKGYAKIVTKMLKINPDERTGSLDQVYLELSGTEIKSESVVYDYNNSIYHYLKVYLHIVGLNRHLLF